MNNSINNLLKKNGYFPKNILDIGAHVGIWTKEIMQIYPNSNYYLFEAIDYPELNEFKNKNNCQVFNNILNENNETVDWYENRDTGDSIYKEISIHYKNVTPIKRESKKLNDLLNNDLKNILVKIDCQGAEIPILKGASKFYNNIDFIILEMPFFGTYNKNVPNFLEHIKFMDSIGFIVFDFVQSHIINNFNMQGDLMFINKNHSFNKIVQARLQIKNFNIDNVKKIAFLSNKLTLRGTEVCLYDYADCNETILGNKSIIITRPFQMVKQCSPRDVHPEAYDKFENRFKVEYYTNPTLDIPEIIKRNNIDILFIEKAGSPEDGLVFDCCKTIIHSVFTTQYPHGTLYTSISDFLNKAMNTNYPVLPYMVRVDDTTEDFRNEFQIPEDAIVFGSYSGADEYNIDYVKKVVCDVATNPDFKNIYFIYLNINEFGPKCENIKFFPGTADMKYKRKFINTCDAMLYGRNGGETFGLACGEFSICGKPVIARSGEKGCSHENILGDDMIKASNYNELYKIVTNWNDFKKDVSNNGYFQYLPDKVMDNFKNYLNFTNNNLKPNTTIIEPSQTLDRKELVKSIVSKIKNGIFVEIGTFVGDFADHILASSENSTLYCIDPYISYNEYSGDSTNNEIGDKTFFEVKERLQTKYGDRVIFIRNFSDASIDLIPDNIDFLYIDGNHSYKYVYNDLKNYYNKVKPNYYIIGDDAVDTDETKRDSNGDVNVQWNGGAYGNYGVIKAFDDFIKEKKISGKIIGNQYFIQKPLLDIKYVKMSDNILYKEQKQITIVTGFFNINRSSWKTWSRTTTKYFDSFKEYLKLDYNMVVFLDDTIITPDFLDLIKDKNIKLIPINMDWLLANTEAWKGFETAKKITNSEYYINLTKHRVNEQRTDGAPQNIYPEYCVINHSKIDFIKFAIENNYIPENNFICWSDFGYHNSILHSNPEEMPSNVLNCQRFNTDKLCFFLRNKIIEHDLDPIKTLTYPNETFTGSLWAGPKELMLKLHTIYQECVKELYDLQISDYDQHIYLRCFMKKPELFELYISDGEWPQALRQFSL